MTHPFWTALGLLAQVILKILKIVFKLVLTLLWSFLIVALWVWGSSDVEFVWPW